MARRGTPRVGKPSGRRGVVLIPLVTLALVAGLGVAAYADGRLNTLICDGPCPGRYVDPPEGVDEVAASAPAPGVDTGPAADPSRTRAALAAALDDASLGSRVGAAVVDIESGATVTTIGSTAQVPASTTKVVTSYAALRSLDPQDRFTTSVERRGDRLVLVGGGDPYLETREERPVKLGRRATLTDLADRTAKALEASGTTSVRLGWDASLFEGPAVSPTWPDGYVGGSVVSPVSALWVGRGIAANGARETDAARQATVQLGRLLERRGISVSGSPVQAGGTSGERVASVQSATVAQILEEVLLVSDNDAAEVMLRHVALAAGEPASFDGGVAAVRQVLERDGIDVRGLSLHDGSGLSRDNRITPLMLAQVLQHADADPAAAGIVSSLPVGGFSGSLGGRFTDDASRRGAGVVRAKTGTLTGVHSLAGVTRDADGRALAFALMTDRTGNQSGVATQAALDAAATALSRCRCS